MTTPRIRHTRSKKQDTQWYREALEEMVRKRLDVLRRDIIEHLQEKKRVLSANELVKAIGGNRNEVLLVWREMQRSGEVVKCKGPGYALGGVNALVNDIWSGAAPMPGRGAGDFIRAKLIARLRREGM